MKRRGGGQSHVEGEGEEGLGELDSPSAQKRLPDVQASKQIMKSSPVVRSRWESFFEEREAESHIEGEGGAGLGELDWQSARTLLSRRAAPALSRPLSFRLDRPGALHFDHSSEFSSNEVTYDRGGDPRLAEGFLARAIDASESVSRGRDASECVESTSKGAS